MEDGSNGVFNVEDPTKNGVASPMMANFPELEEAANQEDSENKVNGDVEPVSNGDSCSSGSDALIIDEKKNSGGSPKESEIINPYFNESLFELSQQHQVLPPEVNFTQHKHKRVKKNPKLREYAQYLGLQPTVQFKCSKCGRAGFESLTTLNEHIVQCTDEPISEPEVPDNSSSTFKLTRKVFLCSACGTYYEKWNLFLHMIEVHRRYLCLYCLGMFSVLDDLCLHLQSKHNIESGHKDTPEEFFNTYTEPCYIVCCECKKIFSEQDNFFYHTCSRNNKKVTKLPKQIKPQIRPEDHITGDSITEPSISEPILVNGTAENNDEKQNISIVTETENFDKQQTEKPVDSSYEIIYSSDDELNLRGFTETGSPVFKNDEKVSEEPIMEEEPVETRKVPKLSLKLKLGSFPEIEQHSDGENEHFEQNSDEDNDYVEQHSDDGEVEQIESENEVVNGDISQEDKVTVAGDDIKITDLELEQPLDKIDIRVLLQICLSKTAPICIYCNHARKIAVNGRQLGLHAIAEHRFSAVVHSITAEELIPESFVTRIKECLPTLENVFFNLESSLSDEAVTFSHVFECFQCRFTTTVHKELYLHNRKLHTKNVIICIMCKSDFYSYSELICHLCPGVYITDYDLQFRCCMCIGDDLPSAFRLMVHLRKRHHTCDVCLETCSSQYRLSNHVWKHKLNHFCYRCCLAYRNKPDITRHLFWKHGTESVLCKKCLQKKWPHMYHFCIPPAIFTCEECNLTFSKAVALKVHKRIHSDEKPHACTTEGCQERFISKRLLAKHEITHREPPPQEETKVDEIDEAANTTITSELSESTLDHNEEPPPSETKPKVDVYNLPELNLSESDSSDSEAEAETTMNKSTILEEVQEIPPVEDIQASGNEFTVPTIYDMEVSEVVPENIWDNFKNYQASKEKFDTMLTEFDKNEQQEVPLVEEPFTGEMALRDHDYCIDPDSKPDVTFTEVKPDLSQSVDHDYCSAKDPEPSTSTQEQQPAQQVEEKKASSSDSSSDSDSSSCSCGSSCSCPSSDSSSTSDSSDSDSSTEEGRKRQQERRERRKSKKKQDEEVKVDVVTDDNPIASLQETPIRESDLETTESDTDEEFYDKQPKKLAKKILEEKRNLLLVGLEQAPNGSLLETNIASTSNLPEEEQETRPRKKSKSKKKKKKKSERKENREFNNQPNIPSSYYPYYQPPTVAPITLSLSRNSPIPSSSAKLPPQNEFEEGDMSLRASKRRRVPNKFYGYSSDEEDDNKVTKWRKIDTAHSSMVVPPFTIKTPLVPHPSSMRMPVPKPQRKIPIKLKQPKLEEGDSEIESNDSGNEGRNIFQVNPNALYCYCKCPYDEVSEMIGCDSRDCKIEWFHFECVGIMVPPKGNWYCPECRKKRQQKKEMLKMRTQVNNT